jgi:hypothetical protein
MIYPLNQPSDWECSCIRQRLNEMNTAVGACSRHFQVYRTGGVAALGFLELRPISLGSLEQDGLLQLTLLLKVPGSLAADMNGPPLRFAIVTIRPGRPLGPCSISLRLLQRSRLAVAFNVCLLRFGLF